MTNDFDLLVEIEKAFDTKDLPFLKSIIESKAPFYHFSSLIYKILNDGFQESLPFGKEVFVHTQHPLEKVFIHQWVMNIIDVLYLPRERALWLLEWRRLDLNAHPWVKYARKYQMAIGLYIDSILRDALSLFEQLLEDSKKINYERGLGKAHYQIGLIYKCINQNEKADYFFSEALKIAEARKANDQITKIQELRHSLKSTLYNLNSSLAEIEILMRKKMYRKARKLLLHSLKVRRMEGYSREARSETMYMSVLCLAFQQENRFLYIYQNCIKDNVVKEKTLSMALELGFELPKCLDGELNFLRQILGITINSNAIHSEFLGVNLNKIKDTEAVTVIKKLNQNITGISKEDLCSSLWNYNYDPVIHDPKIYNLIYRIKKVFKCRDLIIAASGVYRINPKYLNG